METKAQAIKRLVCIGRDARMTRAIIDLDYPKKPITEKLFIISEDSDVHLLHGYVPDDVRYVPMAPSAYQLNFLRNRGIQEISLADARAWIKSLDL
jgi:hypothetical protein